MGACVVAWLCVGVPLWGMSNDNSDATHCQFTDRVSGSNSQAEPVVSGTPSQMESVGPNSQVEPVIPNSQAEPLV